MKQSEGCALGTNAHRSTLFLITLSVLEAGLSDETRVTGTSYLGPVFNIITFNEPPRKIGPGFNEATGSMVRDNRTE